MIAGDVNLYYKLHYDIVYINLNLIPHIVYNEYIINHAPSRTQNFVTLSKM